MGNLVTPNTSDTRHIAGDDWFHQASWIRSRLGTTISNCSSSSPGKNPSHKRSKPWNTSQLGPLKTGFPLFVSKMFYPGFFFGGGLVELELPGIFPKHFFGADVWLLPVLETISSSWGFRLPRNPSCWPLLRRPPWKKLSGISRAWQQTAPKDMPGKM